MTVSPKITGKQSSDQLQSEGRIGPEEAIEDYLGDAGEVGEGGSGSMGRDIEVNDVSEDGLEACLAGLAQFLREWGAPLDTVICVSLSDELDEEGYGKQVFPPNPYAGMVVRVFPEPT